MSFKHIKFEDSITMRSLEKLAVSKGLIKPDAVIKIANKSENKDFRPTNDFTVNIIKLCEGLRSFGFTKQAEEIELKFLLFKKASADNYNTSKEVGEDLVEAAHPEGSHTIENVLGDAVVETIVDQKKKIEDIVNKKPTGKFASNKDIVEAVKLSLGGVAEFSAADLGSKQGVFAKILQLLTRSSPATIETGGAVGAGEVAATGIGATTVSTTASALAIPLAAIVGGYIGYKIFENKFYSTDLKKAYDNCISEANDVLKLMSDKQIVDLKHLKENFMAAMDLSEKMSANAKDPKVKDVMMMKSYINHLLDAMNAAASLMSWARGKRTKTEGMKPGTFVSDDSIWSEYIASSPFLLLSDASQLKDLELAAGNFINVASKAKAETQHTINSIISDVTEKANEEIKQQGGESVVELQKAQDEALKTINIWKYKINAGQYENKNVLLSFLNKAEKIITDQKNAFDSAKENKVYIVKEYKEKLDKVLQKLEIFKSHWIK
jgi:hypothetical protein